MFLLTALSLLLTALQQQTLQSPFTITISALQSQPLTYQGSLAMRGDCFQLQMLAMEAAYDGETLYMYQAETDELTISYPLPDELLQTNPFLLAQALVPLCNVTERVAKNGEETYITLTPKQTKDYASLHNSAAALISSLQSLVIRVRNSDHMPLSLELKEQKQTTSLRLTQPVFSSSKPSFKIEKKDAYINDLR